VYFQPLLQRLDLLENLDDGVVCGADIIRSLLAMLAIQASPRWPKDITVTKYVTAPKIQAPGGNACDSAQSKTPSSDTQHTVETAPPATPLKTSIGVSDSDSVL
jgi:hypothetical protein